MWNAISLVQGLNSWIIIIVIIIIMAYWHWAFTNGMGDRGYPPRWLVVVTPCRRKSKKNDINRKETKTFLLYFSLFTGSNNHSVDEGVFPENIGMVECPVKVSKIHSSFHICNCPHLVFRASIRVRFLLEVCQTPVRVSL